MKSIQKSSRINKKSSLKINHAPLVQELREAARRYQGGISGVSNTTTVSPNTLCNQLNVNHPSREEPSGDVKAITFVDLLFTFKNDTKFVDFFMRYIFEKDEGTYEEACPADLIKTISKASELIQLITEALADGEISKTEANELADLAVQCTSSLQILTKKLRAVGGEE